MLKIVGALLVIGSSTLMGFLIARNYSERPRQLRSLQNAMKLMSTEIGYSLTPLPEVYERVARFHQPPVRDLFLAARDFLLTGDGLTAREAWTRALNQVYPESALQPRDLEVLASMAPGLGISDREDQLANLTLVIERLREEERLALEEEGRNARVWKYLGALAGITLVLLVI